MPGIFPRLKEILFTGFDNVTELVALICFMAGLLPKNHPCFQRQTHQNYGIIKVLAAAANNLEFKWKNIDKIIIFSLILCGAIMTGLYLLGALFFVLTSPAFALGFTSIFQTPFPNRDIAFMMLDRTFGIPGVFDSCVSTTNSVSCFPGLTASPPDPIPFPSNFHVALHELFSFFSMGIFFIALTIFLYRIVNIIFKVTQTGHVTEHLSDEVAAPYSSSPEAGSAWLPIRFVICFGLLLPATYGLNSAQWITLYVAKYGSGLATNAWINYNTQTGDNPTGEDNVHLITRPNAPDSTGLIKNLFLIRSCIEMNYWEHGDNAGAKFVRGFVVNGGDQRALFKTMTGRSKYVPVSSSNYFMADQESYTTTAAGIAANMAGDPFIDILQFSGGGDIRLVFGEFDENNPDKYKEFPGGVLPVCGELTVPVTGNTGEALFASEGYLFAVMNILFEVNRQGINLSDYEDDLFIAVLREYNLNSSLVKKYLSTKTAPASQFCVFDGDGDHYETLSSGQTYLGLCEHSIPAGYWQTLMNDYFAYPFSVASLSAYDYLADTSEAPTYDSGIYSLGGTGWGALGVANPMMLDTGILDYGWGGASIWYNKISERNGSLYTATTSLPVINKMPMVMESIQRERRKTDTSISSDFCEGYNPQKSGKTSTYLPSEKSTFETEEATALHSLCKQLHDNEGIFIKGVSRKTTATNPIEATIQSFFTEFRLFSPKENYEVTPMAQLSSIGRMMVDKAILGIVVATAASAYGGMAHMSAAQGNKGADMFADMAGMASDAVMGIAMVGLTSGFVLHYMLPFMPFLYFFFAVGRWVKAIFEAMVGVPLWALAHMSPSGPGIPGDKASGGYFLLLEIFVRPTVIVFSLIASFSIFTAMAVGLNSVFSLISTNLFGGYDPSVSAPTLNMTELSRGAIDQFFLSIFYVCILYMIATGCFKMIDIMPDNFLQRWAGAGVQSVGSLADTADDEIETWKWQFPERFNAASGELSGAIKDALYNEGKAANETRKAKEAAEAARAKEAAKAQNQQGDA